MQGLILAAGMGKRLGKHTQDHTKGMVKVNGIPLIERAINALMRHGITRVIIVLGYKGDKLTIRFTTRPTIFILYGWLRNI